MASGEVRRDATSGGLDALRRFALPGVILFLLAIRLVAATTILTELADDRMPVDYVIRFGEIATEEGRPYRDYPLEYPPVTVGAIELIGDEDLQATGTRLVWLTLIADLIVIAALLMGWGAPAAAGYLLVSTPVLGALYRTVDVLPVALAVVSVALAVRKRERWAGVVLAAATFAKIWPVVLLPGLFVWGRRRAALWSVGALAVGTVLWVAWAGPEALGQVATQRHTPGWESESTVGTLLRIFGDGPVRIVDDSPRIGSAPTWARASLLIATAGGVLGVWWRARGSDGEEVGAPTLACIAVLLFFSSIFSYPYVLWLAPWAGIALAERRWGLSAMAVGVTVLTAAAHSSLQGIAGGPGSVDVAYAILGIRNLLTVAIPIAYVLRARPQMSRAARPALQAP
jgi:Glycosyltransferase family 87